MVSEKDLSSVITHLLFGLDHAQTLPVEGENLLLRLREFSCWWHRAHSLLAQSPPRMSKEGRVEVAQVGRSESRVRRRSLG